MAHAHGGGEATTTGAGITASLGGGDGITTGRTDAPRRPREVAVAVTVGGFAHAHAVGGGEATGRDAGRTDARRSVRESPTAKEAQRTHAVRKEPRIGAGGRSERDSVANL